MELSGNGMLQALSTTLRWDASVVEPAGVSEGELLASQGGVVLSPGPGRADATLLGVGQGGIAGQGAVATVRFKALADGAPGISIAGAIGRDARNQRVPVDIQSTLAVGLVAPATELLPVIPNPTRGSSTVQFGLAQRGAVSLAIYSVDGRLVRSLVRGVQEAGRYQFVWDGQDDHGASIRSGMFFVRLEAGGLRKTRILSVIR